MSFCRNSKTHPNVFDQKSVCRHKILLLVFATTEATRGKVENSEATRGLTGAMSRGDKRKQHNFCFLCKRTKIYI